VILWPIGYDIPTLLRFCPSPASSESLGPRRDPRVQKRSLGVPPTSLFDTPGAGGVPFHRLERLEQQLGMALPAATQWELLNAAAKLVRACGFCA